VSRFGNQNDPFEMARQQERSAGMTHIVQGMADQAGVSLGKPAEKSLSTRPTPEQIAESRAEVLAYRAGKPFRGALLDHIDVLLAATNPPTDAEIMDKYKAFLNRTGYEDKGLSLWFADGVEAFIGRTRQTCVCGKCEVKL
jgi:hypothetical protein